MHILAMVQFMNEEVPASTRVKVKKCEVETHLCRCRPAKVNYSDSDGRFGGYLRRPT
jgi:hypothetical protein